MDTRGQKRRGGKEGGGVATGGEVGRGRCIIGKDRRGEGERKGLRVLTQRRLREKTRSGTSENMK